MGERGGFRCAWAVGWLALGSCVSYRVSPQGPVEPVDISALPAVYLVVGEAGVEEPADDRAASLGRSLRDAGLEVRVVGSRSDVPAGAPMAAYRPPLEYLCEPIDVLISFGLVPSTCYLTHGVRFEFWPTSDGISVEIDAQQIVEAKVGWIALLLSSSEGWVRSPRAVGQAVAQRVGAVIRARMAAAMGADSQPQEIR